MTLTKEEIHQIQFELRNYSHDVSFCDGYQLATTKYLLQLKAERERAEKLMEALESAERMLCLPDEVSKQDIIEIKTAINEYNNKQ